MRDYSEISMWTVMANSVKGSVIAVSETAITSLEAVNSLASTGKQAADYGLVKSSGYFGKKLAELDEEQLAYVKMMHPDAVIPDKPKLPAKRKRVAAKK